MAYKIKKEEVPDYETRCNSTVFYDTMKMYIRKDKITINAYIDGCGAEFDIPINIVLDALRKNKVIVEIDN